MLDSVSAAVKTDVDLLLHGMEWESRAGCDALLRGPDQSKADFEVR